MKYLIVKDKKRRKEFKKNELTVLSYKSFIKENFLMSSSWYNHYNNGKLSNLLSFYKNSKLFFFTRIKGEYSRVKIHNRCIRTGRAHSVSRRYRLSRISLRENLSNGIISGIIKRSW